MRAVAPAGRAESSRRTKSWVLGATAMLAGSGNARIRGDAPLHARHQRPEHVLPFLVGEPRGILERAAMTSARRVRPEVMAVRGEVDARRIGAAEFAEIAAQVERHAPGSAPYLYPIASSTSRGSLGSRERGMR